MKLTKNFNLSEFECKCGCEMPDNIKNNIIELAKNLQVLRDDIGLAISPTNGYRCESHNKDVGGVPNSQHLLGKAADLKVKGMSPFEVSMVLEHLMETKDFKMGGIGIYHTFTHVDIRGKKARWDKTK